MSTAVCYIHEEGKHLKYKVPFILLSMKNTVILNIISLNTALCQKTQGHNLKKLCEDCLWNQGKLKIRRH